MNVYLKKKRAFVFKLESSYYYYFTILCKLFFFISSEKIKEEMEIYIKLRFFFIYFSIKV